MEYTIEKQLSHFRQSYATKKSFLLILLVDKQEKRNEKVWNLHSIISNLFLGQSVANKKIDNQ